jgi:hypothetical protein
MAKTEVYSWRLPPETKSALETEARRQGESLGSLLERIALSWLQARKEANTDDAREQERLHAATGLAIGTIAGRDPDRAVEVRSGVRSRLRERRAR